MQSVLAHGPGGTLMTGRECIITACFLFGGAVLFAILGMNRTSRQWLNWGRPGRGFPMSFVGYLSWSLAFSFWGIIMIGHGLRIGVIMSATGVLLVSGFLSIMLGGTFDRRQYQSLASRVEKQHPTQRHLGDRDTE
jgi:hypothetical protein